MVNNFAPWDVWLANVAFEDKPLEYKARPVVILSTGEVFILSLKVTTHAPRSGWGEYALIKLQAAGLTKPSTVRISKLVRIAPADMIKKLGKLHTLDIMNIQQILSLKR